MDRIILLQRKLQNKLHRELYLHIFGSCLFLLLAVLAAIAISKPRGSEEEPLEEWDTTKRTAAISFGIGYIHFFSSFELYLKYNALKTLDAQKCRIWTFLEALNLVFLTLLLLVASPYLFPPPFNEWVGIVLLIIIYWLPLIAYKTSQLCRMRELIHLIRGPELPLHHWI